MSEKLISADKLIMTLESMRGSRTHATIDNIIYNLKIAPAVDAVAKDKYDELREAFVDFVCSGVHNPAPYCKNRCKECVDSYGYCLFCNINCRGFNPDGKRREENEID